MFARSDTDHSFYLLAGQVVHNGRTKVLQFGTGGQQTVDGYFGGGADVGNLLIVVRPFGYVEEPFGGVGVFEEVAELKLERKI
jgi:hypothetical protein